MPPFAEEREEAGKRVIETLILRRLIPLGCARAAIDDKGMIRIARNRVCDLYFGHKIDPAALVGSSEPPVKWLSSLISASS